ncbi:MAG: anthranilate phosphoribosyltransferase [Desulfovibrionaceae bacterium]|nr:anthranilate phosphoribosyltransferase [Desulfovibrionaceae bacterium]
MFLLIDNYDSFTYNLVQAFYSLGKEPTVLTNDDERLKDLATSPDLEMVCLSPGPGRPETAGYCLDFLAKLPKKVPVLGVCLGHQILGLFGGARVIRAPSIQHGKQSDIRHTGTGLFHDLPSPMSVGRYHSLVVDGSSKKAAFTVTAWGPEETVMALQYKDRPWVGVQFHPESVLTPKGIQLLGNFPDALLIHRDELAFPTILECAAQGNDLSKRQAESVFTELMDGHLSPAQAGSLLLALRMKGESATELASATRTLLARAVPVPEIAGPHIDIVGTGGDNRYSFNCSTATALTLAGMGYKVTKHGNRAVSSHCGSADALEGLGFPLVKSADEVVAHLEKHRFAFLFAPHFHPAFKSIAPIRKELGVRTLFNILGPLINPAHPTHILLGVGHPDLIPLITDTLLELGQPNACVVCGAGVYDEVTPIGPATIVEIREGHAHNLSLDPKDFGIKSCTPRDLEVHSKREAISVLKDLLLGRGPGPMLDMIVLNVGLAIHLLDGLDLSKAMSRAREAVRFGVGGSVTYAA